MPWECELGEQCFLKGGKIPRDQKLNVKMLSVLWLCSEFQILESVCAVAPVTSWIAADVALEPVGKCWMHGAAWAGAWNNPARIIIVWFLWRRPPELLSPDSLCTPSEKFCFQLWIWIALNQCIWEWASCFHTIFLFISSFFPRASGEIPPSCVSAMAGWEAASPLPVLPLLSGVPRRRRQKTDLKILLILMRQ